MKGDRADVGALEIAVYPLVQSAQVELDFFYGFIYDKEASEMQWIDRDIVEMSRKDGVVSLKILERNL